MASWNGFLNHIITFRINEYNPVFEITAINDIDPLIENHAYLANYDSVYGSLKNKVSVSKNKKLTL